MVVMHVGLTVSRPPYPLCEETLGYQGVSVDQANGTCKRRVDDGLARGRFLRLATSPFQFTDEKMLAHLYSTSQVREKKTLYFL